MAEAISLGAPATYPLDPLDPLDPLNSLKIKENALADSSGLGLFPADWAILGQGLRARRVNQGGVRLAAERVEGSFRVTAR